MTKPTDDEIRELFESEMNRLPDSEAQIRSLRILEHVGGEPRWESERFEDDEPTEENAWADGLLAYAAGLNRLAPRECLFWNEWLDGWDYGHNQQRDRT